MQLKVSSNDVSLCFNNRVILTCIQTVRAKIRLLHWAVWSAYILFAIKAFNNQQQTAKQNSIVVFGKKNNCLNIWDNNQYSYVWWGIVLLGLLSMYVSPHLSVISNLTLCILIGSSTMIWYN